MRFQCRKQAAAARLKFRPMPTTEAEENVLRCNMVLEQDLAAKKENITESKSHSDETLDLVKGLVDRAKSQGLTVKQREKAEKAEQRKQKQEQRQAEKLMKEVTDGKEKTDNRE